jgi:hypothetical protein
MHWDSRDRRWWYLSMALLGLACGARLQGLVFLGAAALVGAVRTRAWRATTVGWTIAAALAAPWYLYIGYHTGDPFWPALPQLARGAFGTPRAIADAQVTFWAAFVPRDVGHFLRLPFDFVINPKPFQPETLLPINPVFLLWPIAWVLAFRDRSVRFWTMWAAGYTAFWFLGLQQLRFWAPALPLAGMGLYEGIRWMLARLAISSVLQRTLWLAAGALSIAAAIGWSAITLHRNGAIPSTQAARDAFLHRRVEGLAAVDFVNAHASEGDGVYVVNASWLNYHLRPRIVDYVGTIQHEHWPTLEWPEDERFLRWLRSEKLDWLIVNHRASSFIPVPQTLPASGTLWPGVEIVHSDASMWVFHLPR